MVAGYCRAGLAAAMRATMSEGRMSSPLGNHGAKVIGPNETCKQSGGIGDRGNTSQGKNLYRKCVTLSYGFGTDTTNDRYARYFHTGTARHGSLLYASGRGRSYGPGGLFHSARRLRRRLPLVRRQRI